MKIKPLFAIAFILQSCFLFSQNIETIKLERNGILYSVNIFKENEHLNSDVLKLFRNLNIPDTTNIKSFFSKFNTCLIQISNNAKKNYCFENDPVISKIEEFGHRWAMNWSSIPQTILHFASFSSMAITTSMSLFLTIEKIATMLGFEDYAYQTNLEIGKLVITTAIIVSLMSHLLRISLNNPTVRDLYDKNLMKNGLLVTNLDEGNIAFPLEKKILPTKKNLILLRFINKDSTNECIKVLKNDKIEK